MPEERTDDRHTILLLGGTGFVGTNLANELERAGHNVLVAGRCADNMVLQLPLQETGAIVSAVRERGVDVVVHMASTMSPSSSIAEYSSEQAEITLPTMRLGAQLADIGVDLIYLSSGGTVYGKVPRGVAAEDDACAPISYYGQAKLGMESDLRFLHRTCGLRYLILRPSNPFGRHQSLRGVQGLVSVALGKIADGLPLEVWGDGTSVRDYIYIDDLIASIRGLIERNIRNVTLNLGSGQGHSLIEVVEAVQAVTGRTLDMIFKPARTVDVPRLVLDVSRLHTLGLHHSRPLVSGIHAYAAELGMLHD